MNRWARKWFGGLSVVAAFGSAPGAGAQVLFDPALGTLPAAQGWLYLTSPFVGAHATQMLSPAHVTLDTTPDVGFGEQAGYFGVPHPSAMLLDRAAGFTITFDLRVGAEAHAARDDNGDGVFDRAGFSVIVLTHDVVGIELGFWPNRVWAYDDDRDGPLELFTQAEGAAIDTTATLARYDLVIAGDGYALRRGGVQILAGRLRDYRAFVGTPNVYEFGDFLFMGDDTGSAESRAEIGVVRLGPALPPACAGDADGDGMVGLADLAALITWWSMSVPPAPVAIDLDGSGAIGLGDVAAVIGNWGAACGGR